MGDEDNVDAVIKALRDQAGDHVRNECALFIARVEAERDSKFNNDDEVPF